MSPNFSLSTCLVLIVAFALVPALVFSAVLVNRLVQEKHDESLRLMSKSADELAYAFDQEVTSTIRSLQAVSMSKSLRDKDLKSFHEILNRVLQTQSGWENILLHDAQLNWIVSAIHPFGAKLGVPPEPTSLRSVLETKSSWVGKVIPTPNGIKSQSVYRFNFAVRIPILDESGNVKYILSAILPVDFIQELATKFTTTPYELTRTLVDQFGVIAARSKDPVKFVGGSASESFVKLIGKEESGLTSTQSLENIRVTTAYRRAPRSGWTAAIGVPSEYLEQQAWAVTASIVISALLLLLLSSVITVFLSRWLTRSLNSATLGAAQLAEGQDPKMSKSKIREIEKLRESLIQASVLLKGREKAKSDFLANMSHELRTPLGIVLGTSDLLASDLIDEGEKVRAWETIKRNGEQLRRLIDDILDLSKVEANKLTIENIRFSLTDLIGSIIEDFNPLALAKGLRLNLIISDHIQDIISADPVRVRQIVSNLLSNAIKFTSRGEISVKVVQEETRIKITVSDTGIGLTKAQSESLFSDFTQVDSSHTRKYGGTGLGLSLSRKLARLLSGDVRLVSSEADKGSVFEFSFTASPAVDQTRMPRPVLEKSLSMSLQKKKILLAEDSLDNVDLIKAYLKNSGAEIQVANNGATAFRLATETEFDLILMDIQMPGMDGFEATELIRKKNTKVPILALTAHALTEQRARALTSGFSGYITKPVNREILFEAISKFIV